MWEGIEARVAENDAEKVVPIRQVLLRALKRAGVVPVPGGATKKMVGMDLPNRCRLVWEIKGSAVGFFVAAQWADELFRMGFAPNPRPFRSGLKDGGRHSGLNRDWSFPAADCLQVTVAGEADLLRLVEVLGGGAAPSLNPDAVTRWIERLRRFFPDLDRFDRPNSGFDARERDYKLETAARMRAAIAAASDDAGVLAAVHEGLVKSNLLPWRAFWSISPKGDGDMARLAHAMHALVTAAQGPAEHHPQALADFAAVWAEAVPNPQRDHPRQIGEFVLMHLAPDTAIYIRHTLREDFWREGFGARFPASADLADTYRNELMFMQAVRDAFVARGLAPRDMIDIQGALWVVHNYSENDAEMTAQPEAAMPEQTPPTNLILYGPPGTGKTYATAWEAVRLCLGEAVAASLREDRAALMAEYKRLCAEGRIEFTTFHQSMSYEEFVEGLRPMTDGEEGGTSASGGFRLEAVPGLLRRLVHRAMGGPSNFGDPEFGGPPAFFKVSPGKGQQVRSDEWIKGGFIEIRTEDDIDWSEARFDTWDAISERWQAEKPGESGNAFSASGIWSLRADMQDGDLVLLTDGPNRVISIGAVTGPYEYLGKAQNGGALHRRPVDWLWTEPQGAPIGQFIRNRLAARLIHRIKPENVRVEGFNEVFGDDEDALPHVLIIDEINRANISKVFGELITLLEPDKRLRAPNEVSVVLPYSREPFGLPANLHIIGTMNTADRSIALLDTALRRRFTFRELMPDASVLPANCEGVNLQLLLETLNARIEYLFDREHQIGHAYFTTCTSRAEVEEVMRYKVIPLLAEYFYEDWAKVAAVLGDGVGRPTRFIEARPLAAPPGLADDELGGEKWRWVIKRDFDFSEFAA